MRVTNVGSGRVSKINFALTGNGYGYSAPMDCSVEPKDCRCYSNSTENCLINDTTDSLPSDGECFLPFSWQEVSVPANAELPEASRISAGVVGAVEKSDDANRVDYPYFNSTISFSLKTNLSYYDCYKHTNAEITNGQYGANYNLTFGYPMTQPDFRTTVSPLYQPIRLVPYLPNQVPAGLLVPWHTSFIGRIAMPNAPGFVERIFYDIQNATSINLDASTPFIETSPTVESSLIIAARDSYQYPKNLYMSGPLQSIMNSVEDNTIKYYFFMGSFPRYSIGSGTNSFKVPLSIRNTSTTSSGGMIKSIEISSVAGMGTMNIRRALNNVEQPTILTTNPSYDSPVLASADIVYTAEINPSLCTTGKCLYASNILLTYDTGKRDQNRVGTSWIKSCNSSTDPACERKIRIVVFGEVDSATSSPVRFDSAPIGVNLSGNAMYETCSNPFTQFTSGTWNQTSGGISLGLTSLKYNLPVPSNAAYEKLLVKITNTSTSNINVKRVFLRQTTSLAGKYTVSSNDILQNVINTNAAANCATYNNNLCTNNKILAPNAACYATVRYLPTISNTVNLFLSALITTQSSQKPHDIYNIPLNFQPILPATVRPVVTSTGAALSTVGVATRLASNGTIGAVQNTLNGVFKITIPAQTFTQTSPTQMVSIYQKVMNTTTTKASLLYQWRYYNNNFTGEPNAVDFITDPNDFRSYIKIGENSLQFMKIFASRQCFYGSDATPLTTSGFTNTEQNCFVKITIDLKHNNMLNTSTISKPDSIDPYIYRINYYSAGRSSINSFIFYVEFNSKPAVLAATNTSWGTITSVGLNTTLNFPAHSAALPDIGTIVGYRVIRTKLTASLTDFFNLTNADITRLDIFNTTSPQALFSAPTTETGRVYFYKVLAIRKHVNFTKGDVLFGFAANKKDHFVTDITNFNFAKVFVPPSGNLYYHNQKILIDTARHTAMEEYSTALTRCTSKTITVKNGAVNSSVAKSLFNNTSWGVLAASEQVDPLWIFSTAPITFLSKCPTMQPYEYNDSTNRCFRASLEVTSGREIRGNLFDYSLISPAYIEPALFYGYSRCMTDLSIFL